ncbi:hypothetical protein ANN_20843 [Periplaneta americana]|uniref:Uncharacterized protein n=1 Tax=Periplaneta americana TaxID=6978 RepID=A0ABQ8SE36_PERAM|nr:hypothetical protein ANN_20843 [Periplaneta americana]
MPEHRKCSLRITMADADKIQDPHLYHLFDGEPVLNVYKADITNLSAGTPGPDLLKHCIDMFQQATVDRMVSSLNLHDVIIADK